MYRGGINGLVCGKSTQRIWIFPSTSGVSLRCSLDSDMGLSLIPDEFNDPTTRLCCFLREATLQVTCDTGFDGELAYSCSVRIQRPNGDVFDRPSVIKQFGDWTIVWGHLP